MVGLEHGRRPNGVVERTSATFAGTRLHADAQTLQHVHELTRDGLVAGIFKRSLERNRGVRVLVAREELGPEVGKDEDDHIEDVRRLPLTRRHQRGRLLLACHSGCH